MILPLILAEILGKPSTQSPPPRSLPRTQNNQGTIISGHINQCHRSHPLNGRKTKYVTDLQYIACILTKKTVVGFHVAIIQESPLFYQFLEILLPKLPTKNNRTNHRKVYGPKMGSMMPIVDDQITADIPRPLQHENHRTWLTMNLS